jgi:hypothetical protein
MQVKITHNKTHSRIFIEYLQELLQIFVDYIVHQKQDLIFVPPNFFLFFSQKYLFEKVLDLHLLDVEQDDEFDLHKFVLYFVPKKIQK